RAVAKRVFEIECFSELLGNEGVKALAHGPSGEQVDAGLVQLARARAGEHESQSPLLHEAVDLVEEIGEPLHLVDDDPAPRVQSPQLAREDGGLREILLISTLVEQIDVVGVREGLSYPGRLPRPAGAEEEEG